jgi:hypothetical protein
VLSYYTGWEQYWPETSAMHCGTGQQADGLLHAIVRLGYCRTTAQKVVRFGRNILRKIYRPTKLVDGGLRLMRGLII